MWIVCVCRGVNSKNISNPKLWICHSLLQRLRNDKPKGALAQNPAKIVGFDPMPLCFLQYQFLQFFALENRLSFEMLGIEELLYFEKNFDVLLCLGVLYHRKSPLEAIKLVYNALKSGGEAVFDSLILEGEQEIALCTFKGWLEKCGFREITHIATLKTTLEEQRKTKWSSGESLEDFLTPSGEQTIEGYPAPRRAYLKAKRIHWICHKYINVKINA